MGSVELGPPWFICLGSLTTNGKQWAVDPKGKNAASNRADERPDAALPEALAAGKNLASLSGPSRAVEGEWLLHEPFGC